MSPISTDPPPDPVPPLADPVREGDEVNGVDLYGSFPSDLHLANDSVTAPKILEGAITAEKLEAILVLLTKITSALSGSRYELDGDGLRLYETDGTTVAVSLTPDEGLDLLADSALGANVARIIRWLLADGTRIASLTAYEDSLVDTVVLAAYAEDASHTAGTSLLAFDHLGAQAGVKVLNDRGFNGATYVESAVGDKLLLDNAGGSDYLFASGSNLPTGLLGTTAWADWTPTLSGWSPNPASGIYRWKQIGKIVTLVIRQPNTGTSNATTKTLTLPVTAATISNMTWSAPAAITDSGTAQTTSGRGIIASAGTTISFFKDWSTGAFTNSGAASIRECQITYEAA